MDLWSDEAVEAEIDLWDGTASDAYRSASRTLTGLGWLLYAVASVSIVGAVVMFAIGRSCGRAANGGPSRWRDD